MRSSYISKAHNWCNAILYYFFLGKPTIMAANKGTFLASCGYSIHYSLSYFIHQNNCYGYRLPQNSVTSQQTLFLSMKFRDLCVAETKTLAAVPKTWLKTLGKHFEWCHTLNKRISFTGWTAISDGHDDGVLHSPCKRVHCPRH